MTGKELKAARKAKGIRQIELMRMLGLRSTGRVSEWERGKIAIPSKHHRMLRRLLDTPKTSTPLTMVPAPAPRTEETLRALRIRAWELGCTVSTARGRFTVYRARPGSPVRKLKSYTTQTGARMHIDRLEAATEMMAAAA